MAGALPARRVWCVEGVALVRPSAETRWPCAEVELRYRDAKESTPDEFAFALWTREIVATLIKDQFRIGLSLVSVGRLLLSSALPARGLCIAPWSATRAWSRMAERYPQIKALAQKERAEIYFGDAAHIRLDHHAGRTWADEPNAGRPSETRASSGMSLIFSSSRRMVEPSA